MNTLSSVGVVPQNTNPAQWFFDQAKNWEEKDFKKYSLMDVWGHITSEPDALFTDQTADFVLQVIQIPAQSLFCPVQQWAFDQMYNHRSEFSGSNLIFNEWLESNLPHEARPTEDIFHMLNYHSNAVNWMHIMRVFINCDRKDLALLWLHSHATPQSNSYAAVSAIETIAKHLHDHLANKNDDWISNWFDFFRHTNHRFNRV